MLRCMTVPPRRTMLRSVAMPAEHGGWGLTLEPGILGMSLPRAPPPSLLGVGQMVLGFAVVGAAALGIWLA